MRIDHTIITGAYGDYKYIMDADGNAVVEPDVYKWAEWFEKSNERFLIRTKVGDAEVSTVFLALDHGWGNGPPVLWETMVFGGDRDGEQYRYTSRTDALRDHHRLCQELECAPTIITKGSET